MANVRNVRLRIQSDRGKNRSKVTVTYSVDFNSFEERSAVHYSERVKLYGKDSVSDDYITTKVFRGLNSNRGDTEREKSFWITTDRLDEDWGKDEVYAKVIITPILPTGDTANSNVVHDWF